MEGGAPSPFVKEGGEVVVAVDEGGVVGVAFFRGFVGVEAFVFSYGIGDFVGGGEVSLFLWEV